MKRIIVAAVMCSLFFGGALAAPADAAASGKARHCATKSAYKKVHDGQSKKQVARLLRSKGHKDATSTTFIEGVKTTAQLRSYRTCKRYGSVSVMFLNGKVISKAAAF